MAAGLEPDLLDTHAAGDLDRLARLYAQAGDGFEVRGDLDAAGFYLTHAYVYALEWGSARVGALRKQLMAMGREE